MAPKLFLTGVTGYIGGDFLYALTEKHPEWEVTCLVRNHDKGALVASAFPKARLVYGDLDSVDVIEKEASNADIVYHFADSDHEPSAHAIIRGMQQRPSTSFWIHTSGTGELTWETHDQKAYGELLPKVYDDWKGIHDLMNQPDHALHRNVDKIVLAAGSDNLKTAIIAPPCIYGPGRGPGNRKSQQVYLSTAAILKQGHGFVVREGRNVWHQVHLHDLSDLYILFGEAAVNRCASVTWNDQGYYLADNGPFVWGDILADITRIAHAKGLVTDPVPKRYGPEEADKKVVPRAAHMVGTNSRGDGIRARKLLNWKPYRRSLVDELPDIVDLQARDAGLL